MEVEHRTNSIRKHLDIAIIDLKGSIKTSEDYNLFKQSIDGLVDKGSAHILLNFRGVNFINSSGLGRLILAAKRINEEKGSLKIVELSDDLRELFTFTRLDSKIPIFEKESEALESF